MLFPKLSELKKLIDLREEKKESWRKRKDIESLSNRIKYASSSAQKASYRKRKIDVREVYKRNVQRIKDKIERITDRINSLRDRIKRMWFFLIS